MHCHQLYGVQCVFQAATDRAFKVFLCMSICEAAKHPGLKQTSANQAFNLEEVVVACLVVMSIPQHVATEKSVLPSEIV